MRRLALILLLICVSVFTGCSSKNTFSESEKDYGEFSFSDAGEDMAFNDSSNPDTRLDSNSESDPDLRLEPLSFGVAINVFRDNGGYLIPCAYSFDVPDNKNLSLTVSTSITPDKSMASVNIPLRIYVFGDGDPLDFCMPNVPSEGGFSKVHELAVNKNVDNIFEINIDINVGKEITMLSILCDYFPEDIPKKGLGAYSGCSAYSLLNSEIKQKPLIETAIGSYFDSDKKERGFDIGKNPLSETDQTIIEHYFYDDTTVSSDDDCVYIKFDSGTDYDIPFYMILFRDGELIAPFDGRYSCGVDCTLGQRSFQYQIPMEFLETNGLHTFRAVALPAYGRISGNEVIIPVDKTTKVRIQVSRGD